MTDDPYAIAGRDAELARLRDRLGAGDLVVISGRPDMGRTSLALAHAAAGADAYPGGIWLLDARGRRHLLHTLSGLRTRPELGWTRPAGDLRDRWRSGRQALARLGQICADSLGPSLVILDDVTDPALVADGQLELLSGAPWLQLVATTAPGAVEARTAGRGRGVAVIEACPLDPAGGAALLRRLGADVDPATATRLVDLLGGVPLCLEQAALEITGGTPATRLLRELDVADPGAAMTDRALDRLPSRAREALVLASLLAPSQCWAGWLEQLTAHPLGAGRGTPWPGVASLLIGRRLLTPRQDDRILAVHPGIAARVLQRHVEERHEAALDALLAERSAALASAPEPDVEQLQCVAASLSARLGRCPSSLAAAERLMGAVEAWLEPEVAVSYAEACLAAARSAGERADLVDCWEGLARAEARAGIAEESFAHHRTALGLREPMLVGAERSTHLAQAAELVDAAEELAFLQRPIGALELVDRAAREARLSARDRGGRPPAAPGVLGRIDLLAGELERARGRTRRALRRLASASRGAESALRRDPDDELARAVLAQGLSRTARVLRDTGARSSAVPPARRATALFAEIAKGAGGDDLVCRWNMAASECLLGQILQESGEPADEPRCNFRQALELCDQAASDDPGNPAWLRLRWWCVFKLTALAEADGEPADWAAANAARAALDDVPAGAWEGLSREFAAAAGGRWVVDAP